MMLTQRENYLFQLAGNIRNIIITDRIFSPSLYQRIIWDGRGSVARGRVHRMSTTDVVVRRVDTDRLDAARHSRVRDVGSVKRIHSWVWWEARAYSHGINSPTTRTSQSGQRQAHCHHVTLLFYAQTQRQESGTTSLFSQRQLHTCSISPEGMDGSVIVEHALVGSGHGHGSAGGGVRQPILFTFVESMEVAPNCVGAPTPQENDPMQRGELRKVVNRLKHDCLLYVCVCLCVCVCVCVRVCACVWVYKPMLRVGFFWLGAKVPLLHARLGWAQTQ